MFVSAPASDGASFSAHFAEKCSATAGRDGRGVERSALAPAAAVAQGGRALDRDVPQAEAASQLVWSCERQTLFRRAADYEPRTATANCRPSSRRLLPKLRRDAFAARHGRCSGAHLALDRCSGGHRALQSDVERRWRCARATSSSWPWTGLAWCARSPVTRKCSGRLGQRRERSALTWGGLFGDVELQTVGRFGERLERGGGAGRERSGLWR